ncbi:WD repeat-containing protein 63, partial [Habropoda laboriosa]
IDWEKEAKETVHLDPTITGLGERRRTIYELDSYVSAGPSGSELMKLTTKDYVPETKKPKIRYSVSLGAPGIARINLSPLTQKVIGCVIGENVSTEYPWVYVRKEIIEDNIELYEESSDFLPVKDEIRKFPNSKLLIGYVPSLTEEGQFYICLSEEGRDVVVDYIQKQREEHENRVRTAVYKPLGDWEELGSGMEIQTAMIKNTRPLLEIEVVATADVLNVVLELEDRKVEDVRDGYIELLPYRQTFESVQRKLIHNMTQVTPAVRDKEAQTALSVPTNCWVQYKYEYESPDIAKFNEEQLESLRSFLDRFTDKMCDQLLLNATWDIYTNDYNNLVRNIRDTQWPIPVSYEEHLSFHDEKHVVDKVINDLCWHPLWSGIAFAAYTSYAKSQHLVGPKSDKEVIKASENNYVLVWSFNDCLSPKLVLESPREVTSVAVNPLDGNLVVGGCGNGQLKEGRDVVVDYIQKQREEHENRVRTAVYKPLGDWEELGSGMEIQTAMIKNTRPLLEIEVVATADVLNVVLELEDRKVEDVRDGYIELLPYRQTFESVQRKLIHNMTQVTPAVRDKEAQTALSVPTNCWVQYKYEYESPDIAKFNEEQLESLRSFLDRFTDKMCDQLLLNATWDIYTNDYNNLVRNIRDTQWPIPVSYEEHLSFHDEKHVVDKVINDLCWHPLWSGIAFAAYTSYAKSQHLVGPKSDKEVIKASENNYVLVWSFNDCLSPKLVLESPREVTSVAVVIWHIPGKIEKVESVMVHTAAQIKNKITIKSLTTWMQEPLGLSIIRPTAMSSMKDSQKGAVTQIIWFSPYNTLDTNGRIQSLPEDTSLEDLSSQFMTAGEDGTIAFWDLKDERWQKFEKKRRPKRKVQTKRPEALTKSISPFKKLDRVFKPHYLLTVQLPNESRNAVITTMTTFVQKFKKKCVDTIRPTEDITVRKTFRNIIKKPDFVMQPQIHIGTVEGDFGCVTWEGYDFTTDLAINTETCKWSWIKKVHDGPITHALRSRDDGSLIATIGGKIFALWKEDLGIPLIWKKSDASYIPRSCDSSDPILGNKELHSKGHPRLTAVSWGSFRPTILILTRIDGSVELWDFMVKSEEPCVLQSLSGRIITGIYTHELTFTTTQCVGFCDFNGILRMLQAPTIFLKTDMTTFNWMRNFVERQITRVKNCKSWQEAWIEANYVVIEEEKRKKQMEEEKKKQMEEGMSTTAAVEMETVVEIQKKSLKPWEIIEASRERWKARELKHMQQVILEKKGLKKDDLEKQREPILKLRQEAKRKKQRLREALQMQESTFEHTKSLFFPKHQPEPKRISVVPTGRVEAVAVEDTILAQEVQDMHHVDPNEEIIYHFMETQAKILNDMQKTPFQHIFNWREILMKGKTRRLSMDTELRKLNKIKKKRKS